MCYIYTITSLNKYDIGNGMERLIYVGSTTDFETRFSNHKTDCFNPNSHKYNLKVYQLIRHHGWDAFVFEVIEVCDDSMTDKELRFREQHYIDKYDSKRSMNTYDAFISDEDMVEYKRLYNAERYKIIREKELARSKENYEKNREKHIARVNKWNKNNRDRVNEYKRNYRHKKSLWRNAVTDMSRIEPSFFC